MVHLVARWTPLAASPASVALSPALIRSSHSLAIIGSDAYVFGGELVPRTPVSADLTILSLQDGSQRVLAPPVEGSWPAARVGSSLVAVAGKLYLWGGRGGKDMGVFGTDEDLWTFDVEKESWESLNTTGEKPEQRSFHVMAAVDNTLFLHAGCPPKGRLATLHSLDLDTLVWTSLPTAPGPGRGGTNLCPLPSSLVRFGGFAGLELDGLDSYDIKRKEWKIEETEGGGPEKRSVSALVRLEGGLEVQGKKVVAVLTMGEREGAPAELGHDGAGFFHQDAWALLQSESPTEYSWMHLPASKESTVVPEARGWFASSFWEGNKVVLQGGLNERNERLGDGWTLEVVLE